MKFIAVIILMFTAFAGSAQVSKADSLRTALASEKSDSKKLGLLFAIGEEEFRTSFARALIYTRKGVALAEATGDKEWLPKFLEATGRMHANLLQLDSALYFFDRAIVGYRAVKNQRGEAKTSFKIAWVYKKRGELDKALEQDLNALKVMEAIDDKQGICDAFTRVATDLSRQERHKEAKEYVDKAIVLCEKYKLTGEEFYVFVTAGDVAIASSQTKEALSYFSKAYEISVQRDLSPVDQNSTLNSRGNAYKRLHRYAEALVDYKKALAACRELDYADGIMAALANIGETNYLMGNYQEAIKYQLETVQLQEKNHTRDNILENYIHTSDIYEKLNDHKAALEYRKKAMAVKDSMVSAESNASMQKLMTQFETEKKEATILSQQTEIVQHRKVQWLGIGVVILLVGFLIFGFIMFRIRSRTNTLLFAKNAENELLLKEIHHRVKNNLEVVSSLLALQSSQIDDPQTKEAMLEGQNRVNSIGIVHQKLYQGENLGSIEMKEYFLNLSENILDTFGAEGRVKVELVMEKLQTDIDTAVPLGLIVNELLTNTLKYAFPNDRSGIISIRLEQPSQGILKLEVADNGTGKSGTTKGTGFGSQLITLLTRQLNGVMREESRDGTRVFFEFQV